MSRKFKNDEIILIIFKCLNGNPYIILNKYVQPNSSLLHSKNKRIDLLSVISKLYNKFIYLFEIYITIYNLYDFDEKLIKLYTMNVKNKLINKKQIVYTNQQTNFIDISNLFVTTINEIIFDMNKNFELKLDLKTNR
jgi:hypothetical protein